ncbi:MAG TPA: glycosyltransferase family 4 protein, partial [Candidatus Binatus sp.]|nr:glycosyltransferase family 4 protein [Candidatus Binatus sp.]
LRALALLAGELPDARLDVVGDHASRGRMEALARELGLDRRVTFHGFLGRAEIGALYCSAAVVALPSEVEGFGITLMEAMHSGVPVIGSARGGSGELIRDGWNGFVVAPGDLPALADRLRLLLTDERRREEMGANGRRTAERFTLAHMVDETLAVYRETRASA